MDYRTFGELGQVSALTLGGGGIGGVWGTTDRAEAVATVHAALDGGITMLDLAPSYGTESEAELVIGAALKGRDSDDLVITTKFGVGDDETDLEQRMRTSVTASLRRMGRDRIEVFFWHAQLRPAGQPAVTPHTSSWQAYQEGIEVFRTLQSEGLIRTWGITGSGYPAAVVEALSGAHPSGEDRPQAVQIVINPYDLHGDMLVLDQGGRNDDIRTAAASHEVPVMAIRPVAAGALTDSLDRELAPGDLVGRDFEAMGAFRQLAAELGESSASLAHRYALSVDGVATVVLGVKNRTELAECLAAEARGPLSAEELGRIHARR